MHSHCTVNIYDVGSASAADGKRLQQLSGAVPFTPSYDMGAEALQRTFPIPVLCLFCELQSRGGDAGVG